MWNDLMTLDTKTLEEAVTNLQKELKKRKKVEKESDWLQVVTAIKNFTDKYDECIVITNPDHIMYINSQDDFSKVAEIHEKYE